MFLFRYRHHLTHQIENLCIRRTGQIQIRKSKTCSNGFCTFCFPRTGVPSQEEISHRTVPFGGKFGMFTHIHYLIRYHIPILDLRHQFLFFRSQFSFMESEFPNEILMTDSFLASFSCRFLYLEHLKSAHCPSIGVIGALCQIDRCKGLDISSRRHGNSNTCFPQFSCIFHSAVDIITEDKGMSCCFREVRIPCSLLL